ACRRRTACQHRRAPRGLPPPARPGRARWPPRAPRGPRLRCAWGDPAACQVWYRCVTEANAPAAPPPPRRGGFAVLVATGIFLSRISGFIRLKIFAHYLGNSDAAGVFSAAYRIPNFLQNLFGEGVLSASFIPVYARLLAKGDEKTAGRVAGIIASLLALLVAALVLIGVLVTPYILIVIAPGFKGAVRVLTIEVVRILFPGIGLLVMSSWCLGI